MTPTHRSNPMTDNLHQVIPAGLLSELGTVAARLELEGSEGYAASVREAGSILAALAAAPQPAPVPADERAAIERIICDAFTCDLRGRGDEDGAFWQTAADALLAAGWTRGGAEAGHHALIAQAQALLSINASGNAVPRVPGLAVEIIERLIAALARPSAPETVCHAQEGIGRMECHKCIKSWALDDPRLPPCREDEA